MTARSLTSLALVLASSFLPAQRTPQQAPPAAGAPGPAGRPASATAPAAEAAEPKPYDKVITAEAKSQEGLIKVHQVKSKVYFEIPKVRLSQELLLVVSANQTPSNIDHAGRVVENNVVRWVLKENRVLLQQVSHAVVADPSMPVAKAVAASTRDTILMSFPVEAFAKDGSPVIEVGRLFTTEVPEFSARQLLGAQMFDASRSFIDKVKAFPSNLNVEAVQTYSVPFSPSGAMGVPVPNPFGTPTMRPGTSGTVTMFYSFVQLPENPMMPRLFDDRLGFFSVRNTDYGRSEHEASRRTYITRWRLEKKDPAAVMSEPVKPITFYIDSATPAKWVSYVKKGVEAWQPAFEAAGFKQGIVAKLAPTPAEDPDFDAGDARYSVIRWVPSTVANAYGPHISDPRTGEILEADIVIYHNILQLQRDWYFTQVAPLDKRAQTLPLPDDLMGDLLAFVVTHEVGHSLGFPHNMKSSSLYPFDRVRDKEWLKKNGHVATLMDYSRFNYVAQPEDGIAAEDLRPKIGPYDIFATVWGYKPIPGGKTPDDEKPTLDAWLKPQETTPWLRFSTPRAFGSDPGDNTEAVGDADAVKATTLGTKNLQRVAALLPTVASAKPGEDLAELEHLYGATWAQWTRELNHVAVLVGGFDSENKHGGQAGAIFTPVPKARQQEAVRFLGGALFQTPHWLLSPELLRRLGPDSGLNRLVSTQRAVLRTLLDHARLGRLQEIEATDGARAYALGQFLVDLRAGILTELSSPAPKVDAYRRNLQRAYLELLNERLNVPAPGLTAGYPGMPLPPAPNAQDDQRGAIRAELKAIQGLASAKAAAAGDRASRTHLEDLKDQVAKALDPKAFPMSSPAATPAGRRGLEDTCWPASDEAYD